MPWKETCAMDEKMCFVAEYLKGQQSMAALCRAFGVTRTTGYKWVSRHADEGVDGLKDRSRARTTRSTRRRRRASRSRSAWIST